MFDTIRVTQGPNYPQTITEKRAPTDESVRILMELEAAAERRVVERGKLEGNLFHACWVVKYCNHEPDLKECVCRFEINNHPYTVTFNLCPRSIRNSQDFHQRVVGEILKHVTQELALVLLETCRSDILPNR